MASVVAIAEAGARSPGLFRVPHPGPGLELDHGSSSNQSRSPPAGDRLPLDRPSTPAAEGAAALAPEPPLLTAPSPPAAPPSARDLPTADAPELIEDTDLQLPFTDVSSELFRLQPQFDDTASDLDPQNNNIHVNNNHISNTQSSTNLNTSLHVASDPHPASSNPTTPSTKVTSTVPSPSSHVTAASNHSTSTSPVPTKQPRKPSPGLAARLKALGFGSSSTKSSPDPPAANAPRDPIGRLTEEQIRQIDLKHQANSVASIIERRGRPWKGASAPLIFSKSFAALNPNTHHSDTAAPRSVASRDAAAPVVVEQDHLPDESTPVPQTSFLPEIDCPGPLDMDTNKYRLPDHTNGNGTKAQPEMRQEHLDRVTSPPSPDAPLLSDDLPPPPPEKDTPPATPAPEFTPDLNSYFTSKPNRAGSIYTLSRASLTNQLAQLTSLQLPDADSLSSRVSSIPTAHAASQALINAAEQIKSWISKASEVIAGLDSEDDVEWAAAGGREGLAEVENAATRFEGLINAYVGAIEELQGRADISSVPAVDLNRAVQQMESIISDWAQIQSTLTSVKQQVEIAMEWEELWNMVLGDINGELDELCRLVFEMEERRHKSIMAAAGGDNVDIGDLETIVEEAPAPPAPSKLAPQPGRFGLAAFPLSPSTPGTPTLSQDDSSLLALFARMQPLRASLDFLPMRLSVFSARAQRSFPTACDELDMRREGLDGTYKKLEKDAESLRKELGEDRWVIVFRGAGRQAQKMIESVERSHLKLKESLDAGHHLTSAPAVCKKIESYDAKKTHYGPAIERVLSIIDKGVKDRLTVNGEILRLNAELQSKWEALRIHMADMDMLLDEIQSDNRGQKLRDSVSSMLSNDLSAIDSGRDTPGSSPPSSVIMASLGIEPVTPTPKMLKNGLGPGSSGKQAQHTNRRLSLLPTPSNQANRRPLGSRSATTVGKSAIPTPTGGATARPESALTNRPRWNTSTNTTDIGLGHNFKPMTLTTPSPYAKRTPVGRSASSLTPSSSTKVPSGRSPLNRSSSASPMPEETPTRTGGSRLSFRDRIASPGPYAQPSFAKPRLTSSTSMASVGNRRASMHPPLSRDNSLANQPARPASSLATGRRSSMLPQPASSASGRVSPQALAGARSAMLSRKGSSTASQASASNKPRWRS
ncbi:cortical protein KAR9-domain-containing protein [Plectosphaerella plurivora]|uniref:Cortical protein KAR9-domain-containing protein n=1 Tax=Plectosphaerella plurivora TaxID=936078 RepID=A0A9P8VH17_9PEZI|nr:cortical protein KAR9-domain-containing protein [Plectosphaerella plurivora]